jgi:hypothetical protein
MSVVLTIRSRHIGFARSIRVVEIGFGPLACGGALCRPRSKTNVFKGTFSSYNAAKMAPTSSIDRLTTARPAMLLVLVVLRFLVAILRELPFLSESRRSISISKAEGKTALTASKPSLPARFVQDRIPRLHNLRSKNAGYVVQRCSIFRYSPTVTAKKIHFEVLLLAYNERSSCLCSQYSHAIACPLGCSSAPGSGLVTCAAMS